MWQSLHVPSQSPVQTEASRRTNSLTALHASAVDWRAFDSVAQHPRVRLLRPGARTYHGLPPQVSDLVMCLSTQHSFCPSHTIILVARMLPPVDVHLLLPRAEAQPTVLAQKQSQRVTQSRQPSLHSRSTRLAPPWASPAAQPSRSWLAVPAAACQAPHLRLLQQQ